MNGVVTVEITKVDKFGIVPHYGVAYDIPNEPRREYGWVPCYILDRIQPAA